jgi:squalene-associated FAD-dependent desaturase
MLRLKELSIGERLRLFRVALEIRRRPPDDSETVEQYLQRLGQSARVCRRLWYPLAIATLNTPPDVASSRLFHEVLALGFLGSGRDSSLGFATVGLSELIEPVGDYLRQRGGDLVCGATVTAIEQTDSGYLVRLKEREPIGCHGIISTLPPRQLARIAPTGMLGASVAAAASIPSSPIVSLYLWYNRPLDTIPALTAMIGTEVEWVFNRRRMAPRPDGARYPGLLTCTISAAASEAQADAGALTASIERELRGAIPELAGATLMESLLIKEKHATFLATPETERMRPAAPTALPRFYLAGDWTDIGLPATIEGAVASGVAAAIALAGEMQGH